MVPAGISALETAQKLLEHHRNIARILPSYRKVLKVISADQPCVDVFYQGKHQRARSSALLIPVTRWQCCQHPGCAWDTGSQIMGGPERSVRSLRAPHPGTLSLCSNSSWSAGVMGVRRGEGWGRRLVARTFTLKVRKKEEQIYRNYNEQTYKQNPAPRPHSCSARGPSGAGMRSPTLAPHRSQSNSTGLWQLPGNRLKLGEGGAPRLCSLVPCAQISSPPLPGFGNSLTPSTPQVCHP